MKNRVRKFKSGKMDYNELTNFKEEVGKMSDKELDEYINSCNSEFIFSDSDIDAIQNQLNEEIKADKRQLILHRFFKICAAVLFPVLLLCGILAYNYQSDIKKYKSLITHKIVMETDNGESSMTILPDGTKVYMGPKSSLAYKIDSFNSETRTVEYKGEGRFSVSKNPKAPFTLRLPNLDVKVLGTIFSLYARENKNDAEVYLEEGSLQLISRISDNNKILHTGETAIINTETGLIKILDNDSKRRNSVASASIYFSSSTINEIAQELQLYYGKEVLIKEGLEQIYFTGSLPTNNLEQAIYILENTLNIAISKNESNNTIVFKSKK